MWRQFSVVSLIIPICYDGTPRSLCIGPIRVRPGVAEPLDSNAVVHMTELLSPYSLFNLLTLIWKIVFVIACKIPITKQVARLLMLGPCSTAVTTPAEVKIFRGNALLHRTTIGPLTHILKRHAGVICEGAWWKMLLKRIKIKNWAGPRRRCDVRSVTGDQSLSCPILRQRKGVDRGLAAHSGAVHLDIFFSFRAKEKYIRRTLKK